MTGQLVLHWPVEPVREPSDLPAVKRSVVVVLTALARLGTASAWQLSDAGVRYQRSAIAKRLSEAHRLGLVVQVGSRMGPLHRSEIVWALTVEGTRVADGGET